MGTRDLRMIVGVGLPALASGLFLPLTLVYFTVLTDISLPTLGAIAAGAVVVSMPLPMLAGAIVDRVGASPVVTASLAVQAMGYVGYIVAREPWEVLVASSVLVCGSRGYWSTIFALLSSHADAGAGRSREWWFGAANVSRTVGITLGGVVTGAVVTVGSHAAYLGVASGAAVMYLAAAAIIPRSRGAHPDRREGTAHPFAALRDAPFVGYTLLNAAFALSVLFLGVTLPTTIRSGLEGPGWLTATYLAGNAVLVAVLGLAAARWTERASRRRALGAAALLWAAGYAVLGAATALPLTWAVAPIALTVLAVAAAEAIHAPASMAWASASAPAGASGRYLALFQYSWVIAEIVAPLVFTNLFGVAMWLPFVAVAGANVAALALLPAVERGLRR